MNNRYREEEKDEVVEETVEPEVVDLDDIDSDKSLSDDEKTNPEDPSILKDQEVKKLNDLYLRTLADTENFKKRVNEERIREHKYGSQRLLEKLVEAMDVFDKAVNIKTDDPKLKNFLIGFNMINDKMKQIIEEEGVKKIQSLNEIFNPTFHHAVETEWDQEKDEDIILEEFQSGYMYKDRVLRPALVKVNKEENKEENNNE